LFYTESEAASAFAKGGAAFTFRAVQLQGGGLLIQCADLFPRFVHVNDPLRMVLAGFRDLAAARPWLKASSEPASIVV